MSVTQARIAQYLAAAGIFVALAWQSDLTKFAVTNLVIQGVLFGVLASVPAYRTGHMSYVDLAWSWGLVEIGVLTLALGGIDSSLTVSVGVIYVVIGLRLGIWATLAGTTGALTGDAARYRYQRLHWETAGLRSERLSIQVEIMLRGMTNMSILAIPALLAAAHPRSLGVIEIVALVLWALFFGFESVADWQKAQFLERVERQAKRRTCEIGLWRYCRHPNYFGHWMQWNAVILLVLPTLISRRDDTAGALWVITLIGLLSISAALYYTLVYYTGAAPTEYYSAQSRPDYAEYQRTTNRFFPGRRRKDKPEPPSEPPTEVFPAVPQEFNGTQAFDPTVQINRSGWVVPTIE
ncbi:DUF1295 domain-containing protein [Nocardia altamirensis]|uniref:DUF1295 domain-containing protein n=1 Tax=Nocardia altamirensis TaxID=472158 RepID=UPI00084076D2|nr:DUF1295 domain-containing protein [Nocardia altamirensis]